MPNSYKETLTTRIVEALTVSDREFVVWDRELPGFGVRVHPSGSKVYMVHKRSGGKSRRVTIGRHGVWSLDAARREAGGIIASLKNGKTPGRPGAEKGLRQRPDGRGNGGAVHEGARGRVVQADNGATRADTSWISICLPQVRDAPPWRDHARSSAQRCNIGLREKPIMANQAIDVALATLRQSQAQSGYVPPEGGNPLPVHQEVPDAKLRAILVGAASSCGWVLCSTNSRRRARSPGPQPRAFGC